MSGGALTEPGERLDHGAGSGSGGGSGGGRRVARRPGQMIRRVVGANASVTAGVVILAVLGLCAVLAGVITSADPLHQEVSNTLAGLGSEGHPLGTDQLGRDVLARLLYGARLDLLVACGAVISPLLIGTALGMVSGYVGGWVDALVMRVVDVVFAFPGLVLLIALVFVLGPGMVTIVVAVTLVGWVAYARLAAAITRREAAMEYVLAAQVGGIPRRRILARHILPNISAQPLVYAMSDAVGMILLVTTLGFLGLGVPPPAPDWGAMIADAQPYIATNWWLAAIPAALIVTTGLGLSLIADGLAARMDTR